MIVSYDYHQLWTKFKVDTSIIELFLTNMQLFTEDMNLWTGVDYCDVLISS